MEEEQPFQQAVLGKLSMPTLQLSILHTIQKLSLCAIIQGNKPMNSTSSN